MTPPADIARYKNHRFPGEIISHGVWLYYRFTLSYRDVEELLCERGVTVSHEAVRQWCRKFGQAYANQLRRRRPRPGDKWYLDEVFLDIVKALCLGAGAVLCGRAYAYGLAAAGEAGVARALAILRADVERTLTLLGCPSVAALDRSYVEVPAHWRGGEA